MKLCYSTLAAPTWTLGEILDGARRNGIQGVDFRGIGEEIDITRLPAFAADLPATLDLFRSAAIEMPCFSTSVTLVSPAPERWQMMLEECQRYARLAEKTGTRFLRIFGGAAPKGMTRDEAEILASRHLRQLIKICNPFGCMPLLETHDEWAGSDRIIRVLHEFDPADVGALWDIEHPYRAGELVGDTLETLRRFLRHVHVKDSIRVHEKSLPRLLGQGDIPVAAALGTLRAMKYDGWLCLETEKRWHPEEAPEPEISLRQFAEYVAMWPTMWPTISSTRNHA